MVHRIIYKRDKETKVVFYPKQLKADLHMTCYTMKFKNEKEMKDFKRVLRNGGFKVIKD